MAIADAYGLTPVQAGILFHAAAGDDAYLNHLEFEVTGPLDVATFAAAFGWIIERHAVLRSGFHWAEADEPLQVVHDSVAWHPVVHDLRLLPAEAQETALRALFDARQAEPMDLTEPPLMRLDLVRLTDHRTAGLWTYHHLVLDGWSLATVYGELIRRYRTGSDYDPPAPRPFRDHVAWLHANRDGGTAYWSAELSSSSFTQLAVPGASGDQGYARRSVTVATDAVADLARAARVTPSVVLHATWALVLAQYAGTDDVVFGTVVSGRPATTAGVEQMVGMFINTVPVRVRLDRSATVGDFLRQQLAAQGVREEHDHVPLVEIRRLAGLPPGDELFGTLLAVENFPVGVDAVALDDGVSIKLSRAVEHTHYPLTVTAYPGPVWTVEAEYRTDHYTGDVVAAMLDGFAHLVSSLAVDTPLARLEPLSPAQQAAVAAYADGGAAGPPATDVVDAFLTQVRLHPDAPAVISSDGNTLSYAELDERSASLAAWLRDRGVGLGDLVAFQMERTPHLAVALLGILRAGAAYLPIDVSTPEQRLQVILDEAKPRLVLGDRTWSGSFDRVEVPRSAPAYVIFTSGSTGTPKGVQVSRGALSDHIETIVAAYGMTADDRMLQIASPAFDLAAEEFFPPWAIGAAVVLAPARLPDTVADFAEFLTRTDVTMVNMAAAYWHKWVQELVRLPIPPRLRLASIGAEAIWRGETEEWLRHTGRSQFFNAYGVTEATITTTLYEAVEPLPQTAMLPIGRPLRGMSVHLLDRRGDPVPPGVIGELAIGGTGVATCYVGRPAASAERFVPDPAGEPGSRRYRTGDLGYWLPDGSLVLTGRADDQVKIRGHRVEPAEIEAVIARHPSVAAVAVVAHVQASDTVLVSYVVTDALDEVRAESEAALASYLRPTAWVRLDAMPMLSSGKIDRTALPAPDADGSGTAAAIAAPATATQEWAADTWRDVLGVASASRTDRFFDLGGHSLTATQVVARARRAFSVELPLRSLLANPSLAEFAAAIDSTRRGYQRPALEPVKSGAEVPLSYTQERLWFLDRLEGGGVSYNITAAWRLDGPLAVPRLREALVAVVHRHAVLRSCYPHHGGIPTVRLRDRIPVDLAVQPCSDDPAAIQAALAAEAHRPFDLAEGPLFRFLLLQVGPHTHVLVVNVHHIVFDGWSHAILMKELATFYQSPPGEPADLPAQYADFAAWQRTWLGGDRLAELLGYWQEALAGPPPVLELPTTYARTNPPRHLGGQRYFRLEPQIHDAARTLARDADATLFVVLLAGFAALLHRTTGQDDVVVGTPIAGRLLPETEDLIGCFFNTLALRSRSTPSMTFRELALAMRETAYAAYEHQEAPFEKVIEAVGVPRTLDQQPLTQVMFVFQNVPHRPLRLGDLTATTLTMPEPAKLDLILTMAEEDGGLVGLWEYNAALFDAATIDGFTDNLTTLLSSALDAPDRPLQTLAVLAAAQQAELLEIATGPVSGRAPATVVELFAAQVSASPDAPAIVTADGEAVDYATLDQRSAAFARWLGTQGVERGDTVAVRMRADAALPVALLGVLKAGAAYVPIDPATPQARVDEMCADARVRLVVTSLAFSDLGDLPSVTPEDVAYVLFTSGSTGRPKGVAVTHRSLTAYLRWYTAFYQMSSKDRSLVHINFGFDLSVPELYAPLVSGGAAVLADPERRTDPRHLTDLARTQDVSAIVATPSFLRLLAEDGGLKDCTALRLMVACGEPLPTDLASVLAGQTRARLDNQYGPTETTVAVTVWPSVPTSSATAPLGRPIDDCRIYLNDAYGQPVPKGSVGELQVGGVQVALGYAGAPGLTADRFRPDPAEPGARLYRTGDLARLRADGELEFLGRADRQLKLRGIRVEPGEVEAALLTHPGVRQAAVIAEGGRLIAFVVPAQPDADLPAYLAKRLPSHLVPAAILPLEALPTTPNGKTDYRALAVEVSEPVVVGYVPPSTPSETEIAAVYADLLGVPKVGAADDFFDLGGQSLLAVRAVTQIRHRFGVDLPLRALFAAPTVAALAQEVDDLLLSSVDPETLAALLETVEEAQ